MKKTILSLTIVILAIFTSRAQLVGTIENGNAIITLDINQALTGWSNFLNTSSNLVITFNNMEIREDNNGYLLVASGTNNSGVATKSTTRLMVEDNLISVMMYNGGSKTTCTSQSCASDPLGCIPYSTLSGCTPCKIGSKDCVKSVTNGLLWDE